MLYIISPFKNEEKIIATFAEDLDSYCKKEFKAYRIIFINDGSKDKTQEILSKFRRRFLCLKNKFDHGKGSALKSAYIIADRILKFKDSDLIVFIDSDGQIKPREIGTMLRIMNLYDADIVIGNKRHPYSDTTYSFFRKIVSDAYNKITNCLFGIRIKDTQCGIKIFKRYALDKVIERVNVKRYAFDLELLIALRKSNFRIVDSPVYIDKQSNSGAVSFKSIAQTMIDTLIIWIKDMKGFYNG
jgi:glycosyltransferase involved in cell wall biosynthesis